jgi:hypothetical protein
MREISRRRFLAIGGSAIGGAMLGSALGGAREARALAPKRLPTYHVRANKTLRLDPYEGGYYVDLDKYRLWLGNNAKLLGPSGNPWAAPLVQKGTFIAGRTLINREPNSGGLHLGCGREGYGLCGPRQHTKEHMLWLCG